MNMDQRPIKLDKTSWHSNLIDIDNDSKESPGDQEVQDKNHQTSQEKPQVI